MEGGRFENGWDGPSLNSLAHCWRRFGGGVDSGCEEDDAAAAMEDEAAAVTPSASFAVLGSAMAWTVLLRDCAFAATPARAARPASFAGRAQVRGSE